MADLSKPFFDLTKMDEITVESLGDRLCALDYAEMTPYQIAYVVIRMLGLDNWEYGTRVSEDLPMATSPDQKKISDLANAWGVQDTYRRRAGIEPGRWQKVED